MMRIRSSSSGSGGLCTTTRPSAWHRCSPPSMRSGRMRGGDRSRPPSPARTTAMLGEIRGGFLVVPLKRHSDPCIDNNVFTGVLCRQQGAQRFPAPLYMTTSAAGLSRKHREGPAYNRLCRPPATQRIDLSPPALSAASALGNFAAEKRGSACARTLAQIGCGSSSTSGSATPTFDSSGRGRLVQMDGFPRPLEEMEGGHVIECPSTGETV